MTEQKKPEVITEIVNVVDWRYVALALVIGAALGAAALYLLAEYWPEPE